MGTQAGDLSVETEKTTTATNDINYEGFMFEQAPDKVQESILPLYIDSCVLRALQESMASELAARMNAMGAACDNAEELQNTLSLQYNRGRQAKITGEILEIVAGASAGG